MKQYWNSKEIDLNLLIENGYIKFPKIPKQIDLENYEKKISHEMKGLTFSSKSIWHSKFLKEIQIEDYLTPKLFKLAQKIFGYQGNIENQYHIVRMVKPGDSKEKYRTHFDSHIFTLVIPIAIPKSKKTEEAGELILKPNARRFPKSEFENMLGKIYFKKYANKNKIDQLINNNKAFVENFTDMKPILFLGRTTLHTNKALNYNSTQNRMTILAHFFDPSPKIGIGYLLRKLRNR